VSDLQCPATFLFACHGEAEDAVDAVDSGDAVAGAQSDHGSRLTDKGRAQVRHLVEQVRSRRIAAVYSSTMHQAIQSAELASSELGTPCIAADGLQELSFEEAIEDIADTRRGETVLVFTHGAVMSLAVARLSSNVRNDVAAPRSSPGCVVAEVQVDADGWRLVSWPSGDVST